jgi:hypothetical protein
MNSHGAFQYLISINGLNAHPGAATKQDKPVNQLISCAGERWVGLQARPNQNIYRPKETKGGTVANCGYGSLS